jgi:hypothetical protein
MNATDLKGRYLQSGYPNTFPNRAQRGSYDRLSKSTTPSDEPLRCYPSRNKSPHKAWFGKPPQLDHLRRFGRAAFPRFPTEVITKGAKLEPRWIKCALLVFIDNHIYLLGDPEQQQLIISRHVKFHEDVFFWESAFGTIANSTADVETPSDDDVLDNEVLDLIALRHPAPPPFLPT